MTTSSIVSIIGSVAMLAACGGDGDDGPMEPTPEVEVFGQLDPGYDIPAGTSAIIVGGTVVDQVVALPVFGGGIGPHIFEQRVTAQVEADGTFEMVLDEQTDWVLLLINSASEPQTRVVAYVAIPAGDDALQQLPIDSAGTTPDTISLGTIDMASADGTASADETDSTVFGLTVEELLARAAADDGLRSIVNGFINFDPDTNVYWFPKQFFSFVADLGQIDNSSPDLYPFSGYQVLFETNDSSVSLSSLCDKSATLELVPPADVENGDGRIFNPTTPLDNSQVVDDPISGGCNSQDVSITSDPDGRLGFAFPIGGGGQVQLLKSLVEGNWALRIDGESQAVFDIGLALPFDGTAPTVPVPVPRLTVDANGMLEGVSFTWHVYDSDAGAFTATDTAALAPIMENVALVLTDDGTTDELFALHGAQAGEDVFETEVTSFQNAWTTMGTGPLAIQEVFLGYELGGNAYNFTWVASAP